MLTLQWMELQEKQLSATKVHFAIFAALGDQHWQGKLSAQLNVKNVFNKEYYTAIRNNGWAIPGDARSAVLNINYHF